MKTAQAARFSPSTQCEHCGNTAAMEIHGRAGDLETVVDVEETETFGGFSREVGFIYELLSCSGCKKVNLARFYFDDLVELDEDRSERNVIYPAPPSNPVGLPDAVRATWEATLRLRYGDGNVYAGSLRRLLEAVCLDRMGPGAKLGQRLRHLANQEDFPQSLVVIANLLRELGNIGAHADGRVIAKTNNRKLEELMLAILSHVYQAPLLTSKAAQFAARQSKG